MKSQHCTITFREEDVLALRALAMAERGRGNAVIMRQTGLTPCMVNRRLAIGNKLEPGYKKGSGYRTRWRDGTSQMARIFDELFDIEDQMLAISKRLAPRRAHVARFAGARKKQHKINRKIIRLHRAA